jgi:histidyl-tRNA synthetase
MLRKPEEQAVRRKRNYYSFSQNIIEKQFPFNDLEVLKFLMSLLKLIPVPNNRPYPIFITFL